MNTPQIPDAIRRLHDELAAIRHDLHAHPELAFEEYRTADLVADRLAGWGIEVHRGVGRTGVVGVLRAGSGDGCIALRADMDALPVAEQNTFAHRSRHDGRMHACGHDGHTTMLLGAARHLAETRNFDGIVCFVFQPAEEGEGGAPAMIADGLFDRWPIRQIFGLHNWPGIPVGRMAVMPGPIMACADRFDIVVRGHGAHAAMPQQGIDPVVVGSQLVQAIQTVVSRSLAPVDAAVVSVTRFHAGDAYNVIPPTATLGGTVRAFEDEVRDRIEDALQRLCNGIAAAHNAQIDFSYHRGYPPTVNEDETTALCRRVAAEVLGAEGVVTDARPTMGAEDFSYFQRERPGCYVWLGNGPGEGGCTLHNPRYDFNDEIIGLGVAYWTRLVETALPVPGTPPVALPDGL